MYTEISKVVLIHWQYKQLVKELFLKYFFLICLDVHKHIPFAGIYNNQIQKSLNLFFFSLDFVLPLGSHKLCRQTLDTGVVLGVLWESGRAG